MYLLEESFGHKFSDSQFGFVSDRRTEIATAFQKLRATFQKSIFKSCVQFFKVLCTFQKLRATFKSCVRFSKVECNFQKLRALFKSCAQLSKSQFSKVACNFSKVACKSCAQLSKSNFLFNFQKLRARFVHFSKAARNFCVQLLKVAHNF